MAGRPKTIIPEKDLKKAETLAFEGHQTGTICELMDWDRQFVDQRPDILTRLRKKRAERKVWLRKQQNRTAAGDSKASGTMQIFLGKNELEQSDKQSVEVSGVIGTRELSDDELRRLLRDDDSVSGADAIAS